MILSRLLLCLCLCVAVPAQVWAGLLPASACPTAGAMTADAADESPSTCQHAQSCCVADGALSAGGAPCKPGQDCQRPAPAVIGLSLAPTAMEATTSLLAEPTDPWPQRPGTPPWRPPRHS